MQVTRVCINATANLKDLVSELQEVTDWFHLGICLGILLAKLQSIKRDYRHIDERRREVLLAWRDNEKPTWPKLVSALVDMRNISLAYQIAGKYGNKTVCKQIISIHNVTLRLSIGNVAVQHHSIQPNPLHLGRLMIPPPPLPALYPAVKQKWPGKHYLLLLPPPSHNRASEV